MPTPREIGQQHLSNATAEDLIKIDQLLHAKGRLSIDRGEGKYTEAEFEFLDSMLEQTIKTRRENVAFHANHTIERAGMR